eukprot:CAMPEP_0197416886 /NCGR_PEP_ID=MMETSP1170-20131217/3080_1 /TAXON_ID=54406 /ORGANISM="Sarcinochrysis sp, Strain CCMP770" /LENGTH=127 /DNA_ID=CAMNT_0042943817 /DNA_START=62 /DNA_END=445 /DNA_ORIENTATION=-
MWAAAREKVEPLLRKSPLGKHLGPHSVEEWVYALLMLGVAVLIDFVGTLSYVVPGIGDLADVIWAPISAVLVKVLYGSTLLAACNFVEELLPGLDFIPTATIAWANKYRDFASRIIACAKDLQKKQS